MCVFKQPKLPDAPAPPPAPPPVPQKQDPSVLNARSADRRKAALAGGRNSTILTSGGGISSALGAQAGAFKTLLGS